MLAGLSTVALSSLFPHSNLSGLLGLQRAAAQDLPALPANLGNGRKVAVVGAGISGLTCAYELLHAGFDVTVFEGLNRYGGRSLTVRPADRSYKDWYLANSRFVTEDSYCDFIPAEVRGAMVPELQCDFVPVRQGAGFADLHFNAGPGRIPTHHTGVLHYCREFGVEMLPYLFVTEANLLQASDFNGGKPVELRQVRFDMRNYVAQIEIDDLDIAPVPGLSESLSRKLREFLIKFGSPASGLSRLHRAGYLTPPGAGTNSGIPREAFPLSALLEADELWFGLLAGSHYDWQLPLLEPAGGMDMIWQAFLRQSIEGISLRDRVRLEHGVTGMRYADPTQSRVLVTFSKSGATDSDVFDYVVVTGKPFTVLDMDTDDVLEKDVPDYLDSVLYERSGKFGWQARSRFWENLDVGIFGGISWTDHMIGQIWYPSSGYHSPTGVLVGAYVLDSYPVDRNGNIYRADDGYRGAVDPATVQPSELYAGRWHEMDHVSRTRHALAGGQRLHPDFSQNVFSNSGLSISWGNQPYQRGLGALDLPLFRPRAYGRLIQPIDQVGRIYLAGDSLSHYPGWQEGAVRSAWWTVGQIKDHVVTQDRDR